MNVSRIKELDAAFATEINETFSFNSRTKPIKFPFAGAIFLRLISFLSFFFCLSHLQSREQAQMSANQTQQSYNKVLKKCTMKDENIKTYN